MKKLIKTTIIFIICSFILGTSFNNVYAETNLGDIIEGGDYFYNARGNSTPIFNDTAIEEGTTELYFIILGIGIAVAVIVGIILGIQLITSGAEGQAKVKEKLLPYVVGCIVIFGGLGIWRAVVSITQELSKPSSSQTVDGNFIGPVKPNTTQNPW